MTYYIGCYYIYIFLDGDLDFFSVVGYFLDNTIYFFGVLYWMTYTLGIGFNYYGIYSLISSSYILAIVSSNLDFGLF